MIENELKWVTNNGQLTIVHPYYQIFPIRLEIIKFDDIWTNHIPHNDFKSQIRKDIKENGLLCPLVLNKMDNGKYELMSGNHRFVFIKKHANASLCYVARNKDETFFLTHLNKIVWEKHTKKELISDFEFLFTDERIKRFTDKCTHLLTEGVTKTL
jgi:hypothetical protein